MKAIVIAKSGGPEVLTMREVKEPVPGKDEVRVRVKATAVNRADILQRLGYYPAPPDCPADIPGLEFAGEVEMLGSGASDFHVGERVFGLLGGGSYAEFAVVHQRTLVKIPDRLSFVEAAAIPEVFITAYDAMVSQCNLRFGQTVLIHAVGSGVGLAALQIAKMLGCCSIGTARREDKITRAKQCGLDQGIVVQDGKFSSFVLENTDGAGVDLVLELVGGSYVAEDIICTKNKGHIIVVGLVSGNHCQADLGLLLKKRLTIKGTTMRMRPLEEKIMAARMLAQNLVPLFEKKMLQPVIDKVLPWEKASEAHEYIDMNENFGKVVLTIF